MKKLLALALALIMVLSLGSALADEKTTVIFWYEKDVRRGIPDRCGKERQLHRAGDREHARHPG